MAAPWNGCVRMADYKKMYLTLFHASEEAINLLVKAQQECEELYMSSPEPEAKALESPNLSSAP